MKMLLTLSMLFNTSTNPLIMTLILLTQTILSAILIAMWFNSWISMILLVIYSGGMLVVFIYITSMASNEKYNLNMKMLIPGFIVLTTLIFMKMTPLNSMKYTNQEYSLKNLSLIKLFTSQSTTTTIMMMIYLLLTLFIVVFITDSKKGPLRKIN